MIEIDLTFLFILLTVLAFFFGGDFNGMAN
jgi:hypothetical protein